jgi:branched-chain amino acid transport system ATP-binding protein
MSTVLESKGLTVSYGGLHANDHVDLKVNQGNVVGLIGPNGAGKTTFIDAITGFTAPTAGQVLFDGREINHLSPAQRADIGLTRTFQSLELFDDLTVWDNLLVHAERPSLGGVLLDLVNPRRKQAVHEQAEWALDTMGLHDIKDRLTFDLSHGQRKLVSVARALANRPKLVLLDEPAAGLDTAESQILGSHLRDFLTRDITVFLIDHDMGLVLNVCDYIYVLDFGRIIAEGTPAQIRTDAAVIGAYLGQEAGEIQAASGAAAAAATAGRAH